MADRVLIFASDPGRVRHQLSVPLARPRDANSSEVRRLVDEVYALMTAGTARAGRAADRAGTSQPGRPPPGSRHCTHGRPARAAASTTHSSAAPTCRSSPKPASSPTTSCCRSCRRCRCSSSRAWPTATCTSRPSAASYVDGRHAERQAIFGRQLIAHVPFVAHIRHSLDQEPSGELPEEPFLRLLQESSRRREAERVMKTAIEWGRHGEVFEYDYHTGLIHLPEPKAGDEAADSSIDSGRDTAR